MGRVISLACALWFLTTVDVGAEEQSRDGWLTGAIISGAALQGLDAGLTIKAIRDGPYREANPVLRWTEHRPAALVVVKTATTVGTAVYLRWLRKRRPKAARVTGWAIAGFYGAFVIYHHTRQAEEGH